LIGGWVASFALTCEQACKNVVCTFTAAEDVLLKHLFDAVFFDLVFEVVEVGGIAVIFASVGVEGCRV
jgi:hypothetical protein